MARGQAGLEPKVRKHSAVAPGEQATEAARPPKAPRKAKSKSSAAVAGSSVESAAPSPMELDEKTTAHLENDASGCRRQTPSDDPEDHDADSGIPAALRFKTIRFGLNKVFTDPHVRQTVEDAVIRVNRISSRGTDLIYSHVLTLFSAFHAGQIDLMEICGQLHLLFQSNIIRQA